MPLLLPEDVISEKNKHEQESPWLLLLTLVNVAGDLRLNIVNNNEDVVYKGVTYTAVPFEIDTIPEVTKGSLPTLAVKVTNVDRMIQGLIEKDETFGSGWDVKLSLIHMSQANRQINCSVSCSHSEIVELFKNELNRCPAQDECSTWDYKWDEKDNAGESYNTALREITAEFIKHYVEAGETFNKAEIEQDWVSLDIVATKDIITINLGLQNPIHIQFPKQKYTGTFCQRVFDGPGCPYSRDCIKPPIHIDLSTLEPYTYCNKTLSDCKKRFSENRTNDAGEKIGLPYLAFNGIETRAIYGG